MKKKNEISLAIHSGKEKKFLQPRERFELSTPGLRDQCSNHWANEAHTNTENKETEEKKIKKNRKQRQLD